MISPLAIWILSVLAGALIGSLKGRVLSGVVWCILFGPLGLVIILCLPDLKKQEEDERRSRRMQAELEEQRARGTGHQRALEQQLELQREQIRQLQQLQQQTAGPRPTAAPDGTVSDA